MIPRPPPEAVTPMIGGASPAAEPAVGTSTRVEIFADATARTLATAHLFVRLAQEAVVRRGWFTVALSGGSTPRDLYLLLATDRYFRATVPWSKIQFFFGDERPVPPNHAESNYRMVNEAMFARLPPGLAHVYRINGELQYASEAALDYETEMRGFFGPHGLMEAGFPRFDLVFLGLGIDGHTASLFPGSPALREKDSWVVSNWVERLKSHRITMTYPVLNSAREVVLLVGGAEKAPIVAAVLGKTSAAPLYPVQAVKLWNGTKRWMLDQAAAARLPAVEIIADPTKSETVGAMAALPSTS